MEQERRSKHRKPLQETTVQEAKEQLAKADDGDTFVWGTRTQGTKAEFERFLASQDDGDAIVWGN